MRFVAYPRMEDQENGGNADSEFWTIHVHVHGKKISISVGDATQRIKWVAQVGIARWDDENCQGWKRLGIPIAAHAHFKDGNEVDLGSVIKDVLRNGDHIYINTSLKPQETK